MTPLPYYCTTNSAHEHTTEWEAENCSEMHAKLRAILDWVGLEEDIDYEDLLEDIRTIETQRVTP